MSTVPDMLDEMIGANEEPAPEPIAILRYRPHPLTLTRHRDGLVESLTRREIEVLGHMAEGHSNARIARQLFISEATVKAHVKHILRKLGASNRAEAVSRYLRAS
jgi:DNA-binding CsgD family transcriptional regulator